MANFHWKCPRCKHHNDTEVDSVNGPFITVKCGTCNGAYNDVQLSVTEADDWDHAIEKSMVELAEKFANSETKGSIGKHDWCLGQPSGDGIAVFVDDRPAGNSKSIEGAQRRAKDFIARIQADGDYRLNDKPQGFIPPRMAA